MMNSRIDNWDHIVITASVIDVIDANAATLIELRRRFALGR